MKLFRITVRYKNVQYIQSCGVHWGALGTDILHTVCIMLTSPVLYVQGGCLLDYWYALLYSTVLYVQGGCLLDYWYALLYTV